MGESFSPTSEELRKAKIVLGDALPYELAMLDIGARFTQKPEFTQLKKDENPIDWLTYNATVEAFWTHARCLIEFFNRSKNNNFDSSSASARDFAHEYWPSKDMRKLYGTGSLFQKINEQVSHVGFCRKTELYEKLGSEMAHVKWTIDDETRAFEAKLQTEFREYWTWKPRQEAFVLSSNIHTASCQAAFLSAKISW
jgi:hypothetical protein